MKVLAILTFYNVVFDKHVTKAVNHKYDYCIVGAGPAGLQMGYYLDKAGRNYVIFEQDFKPDQIMIVFVEEYFPHADTLVKYLKDFSRKFSLRIKYKTKISNISYDGGTGEIRCRFSMRDQRQNVICCRNLFIATGLSNPVRPKAFGDLQYIENYDTVSTRPENFEGQSVLILGRGNSGMELANSIYGFTNYIHLMGRSRVRLSWETHYVGDIRAVNNEIIDSYMLKSLDGFIEVDVQDLNIRRRRDSSGKLDIIPAPGQSWDEYNFAERVPSRNGYDRIIACLGFKWDRSIFSSNLSISNAKLMIKNINLPIGQRPYQAIESDKYPMIDYDYQSVDYPGLYFIGALSHSLDYRKSAGGFIHGFRYTIRSLHKALEYRNHGIKWPSKVFKIKQLARAILDRASEASGLYQMFGHLCDIAMVDKDRDAVTYLEEYPVNLLPSLTKYSGHKFTPNEHRIFVLTLEYGKNFSEPGDDRFSANRAKIDRPARFSNFLHPKIYYFGGRLPTGEEFAKTPIEDTMPKPDAILHIHEDFTTVFDGENAHKKPLRKFLEKNLNRAVKPKGEECSGGTSKLFEPSMETCKRYL